MYQVNRFLCKEHIQEDSDMFCGMIEYIVPEILKKERYGLVEFKRLDVQYGYKNIVIIDDSDINWRINENLYPIIFI